MTINLQSGIFMWEKKGGVHLACDWHGSTQDPQNPHMFHGFEGMNHQGKSLLTCSHLPVRHDFSAIAFEPDKKRRKEFKRVGEYHFIESGSTSITVPEMQDYIYPTFIRLIKIINLLLAEEKIIFPHKSILSFLLLDILAFFALDIF